MSLSSPRDVSAVVCTLNSMNAISECLTSLREAGIGQIVVVDAHSTDGTRQVADELADLVVSDAGHGLGNARNIGINHSTRSLILNVGSDNVFPEGEVQKMIDYLENSTFEGVSARTYVAGNDYLSRGLNAWRLARFSEGEARVIGTPTLFYGDTLRSNPFDPRRRFSDDSELCERWTEEFGARFAISDAWVIEIGKTSWAEIKVRARMYGTSDQEIYQANRCQWTASRKLKSLTHPFRVEIVQPLTRLHLRDKLTYAPFFFAFCFNRYLGWRKAKRKGN